MGSLFPKGKGQECRNPALASFTMRSPKRAYAGKVTIAEGPAMPLPTETIPAILPDPFRILAPDARGLPLQGVTVLAVEDSRFASDALRLLCQRSGARLRRAENLEQAWAHLRVYRPDVMLVDLGLPDGRGDGLIRRLAATGRMRPVLLGISGDTAGKGAALSAGADGFIEKPIASLATFQQAILAHLPGKPARSLSEGTVSADPAALHDDLQQAARTLRSDPGPETRQYLAGFLGGLARQSRDTALSEAVGKLSDPQEATDSLTTLLKDRLAGSAPFQPGAV